MNNLQDTFQTLSQALGWALLHSLWQGFLLFGLLWVILKIVPAASAKLRYRLSFFALGGIATWFVYTAAGYWQSMQSYTVTISTQADTVTWQQSVRQDPSVIGAQVVRWLAPIEGQLPVLVAIYFIGVAALFARLIYNIAGIRSLTTQKVQAPTAEWLTLLESCMQQLGIARQVRLLFSEKITVPMITGTIKPVILVPLAMITRLDTYQAEAILIHELAHIRRYDYLVNIVQTIVETILFFNPFVWGVSNIIHREREHCCDDVVLDHTQWPLSYAHALTTLESYRQNPLAMAATGNNNQLLHRIKRMMEMNRNNISYGPAFTVSLAVLLAVSFIWLTPALAQSKKDKDKPKEAVVAAATPAPSTTEVDAAPAVDSPQIVKKERITIIDPDGNKHTYNSREEVPEKYRDKLTTVTENGEKVRVNTRVIDKDGKREEVVDIERTIKEALDGVDWSQVNRDINGAMDEVHTALKEIDWNKISAETTAAMEESHKAMEEAKKAMADIDWNKIDAETKKAMEEAKKAMAEAEVAMKESEKAMRAMPPVPPSPPVVGARPPRPPHPPVVAIPSGGPGNSYERMLDRMDGEGLIDRDKKFKVEKKNDALYIDGNKQSPETYRRYSRFLSAETVSIKGNKGTLEIKVRK
ncbi:M56 family metallopeptidase [Polluticoccus soli]|uniref:M56 family metallopeptidase n=1 Tax=Polluticoccus soli TaxID=3034150 RepID=UPI0023E1E62E|nr:M56 family metallopeptidase [Flavipsychrobacter sp. JY13-12]